MKYVVEASVMCVATTSLTTRPTKHIKDAPSYQINHSTYQWSVGRKKYWDCVSKQLMSWTPSYNLVSEKEVTVCLYKELA